MGASEGQKRVLLQGNEAIVQGALAAGCRFFAGGGAIPLPARMRAERRPEQYSGW